MHSTAQDLAVLEKAHARHSNGTHEKANGRVGHMGNAELLESTYEQWKVAPESVDPTWRAFFEGFELGCQVAPDATSTAPTATPARIPSDDGYRLKQAHVYNLLFTYRTLGHLKAQLDPLGVEKAQTEDFELERFKFTPADLDLSFDSGMLAMGGERTLREIITILEETYCRNIGVEYMHIQNFTMRRWLRDKMETCRNQPSYAKEKKKRILNRIHAAENFEKFLHTRYVGQKRFSLEGGETLIAMLDALIEMCPSQGVQQVVMGMAHRGRLNVLANILGKEFKDIFDEFADNYIPKTVQGDGDVKYHLGFDGLISTSSGHNVTVSLAPNPSHLEAVNPVVEGKARARQRELSNTEERNKVLPLLIHGDAAVIGQGIVAETLNLSQLEGYRTGGTVHLVINNQIGFTTIPKDARSTTYCTAMAKMLGAPIFHVNGDDPEAAVYLIELALEFRQKFNRDVFIDLVCYRRHGHNEGDEPYFTQPTLYSRIDRQPAVSTGYAQKLIDHGDLTADEAEQMSQHFTQVLNDQLARSKAFVSSVTPSMRKPISTPEMLHPVDTRVDLAQLRELGLSISAEPQAIKINNKIKRLLAQRRAMAQGEEKVDWAFAELLAFGSLLVQDVPIRLSGQDSRRGTFSQRHSALYDMETRERYIPLKHIRPDQATFCVYNSPLSEAAVLGFDYGYSLDCPNMLILWEAQFGDFVNGAQTIIDQYITSSESKWGVTSRLVLLLPHGYHGQGPEHSSARLERFLQACAEDNIQVAHCTTPANHYHMLRRQALRAIRKPLVVMTPKGLLRDKRCTSSIEELAQGQFQEIIGDSTPPEAVKRVILCSGKVYYDLDHYRQENQRKDTAILRLEQLYPLHEEKLKAEVARFAKAETLVWCQEESQNMGAWSYVEPHLRRVFGKNWLYAGRDASASPATGYLSVHELEQKDLVQQAFTVS